MISTFQETDSKIIFTIPYNIEIPASNIMIDTTSDETAGGNIPSCYIPIPEVSNLVVKAWHKTSQIKDKKIAIEVKKLLGFIHSVIEDFKLLNYELGDLKPLHLFLVEDGSILVEWIFDDFRIGFNFEQNLEESSWYLVTNENLFGINASGYIVDIASEKFKLVLLWLINFVLSHS